MSILFLASFFGYASLLALSGYFFSKKQKSSSDFMIGSRSINYWVTAIATHATDMSAWLFMGLPGAIYSKGLFAAWSAIGLIFCMFLSWQFIAKRLRLATEHYKTPTLASYFEKRFNDSSGLLRIISSLIALLFFMLYISAGIVALGRALEATFGLSYHTSISIGTLVVASYTILGGYVAIAWNDFLQGLFVLAVTIFFPLYALFNIGGIESIIQATTLKNISLSLFPDYSWQTISSLLTMSIGWGIGYFGQPHILINFMGINKPEKINKAKYIGLSWQFVTLSAAILIGLIGIPFFKQTLLANSELVFIDMVKALFNPFFAGFVLCAILAAAVSTMDSQILVSASMLAQDIYKKLFHKSASQKLLLQISRIAGVAIILVAFFFAFDNNESIFSLVRYAWCGLGSTFGPILLLSLYSKKITRNGALAGILLGGITAGIWKYLPLPLHNYPVIPGFIISLIGILLFSRIEKK